MALFVIPGIPWLAGILASLFLGLLSFFAQYLTKRLAVIVAVVLALAALTTAFFAAVAGVISGLAAVSPPQLAAAMGLILPDNLPLIISAVFTARVTRWVYEWNVKVIQYRLI